MPRMYSMKSVCDREDVAFICVASTALAAAARRTWSRGVHKRGSQEGVERGSRGSLEGHICPFWSGLPTKQTAASDTHQPGRCVHTRHRLALHPVYRRAPPGGGVLNGVRVRVRRARLQQIADLLLRIDRSRNSPREVRIRGPALEFNCALRCPEIRSLSDYVSGLTSPPLVGTPASRASPLRIRPDCDVRRSIRRCPAQYLRSGARLARRGSRKKTEKEKGKARTTSPETEKAGRKSPKS
eukprot:1195539-Prorocentrum_minimum.AAC.6